MIKSFLITALVLLTISFNQTSIAEEAPSYQSEALLPKGWPEPGPFDVVSQKEFPAYRAAYTQGAWKNFTFMRLFKHIKREGIPMTAPVEMNMEQNETGGKMKSMGFLYQNTKVGKLGKDGEKIEVRDVPVMKTLCYTWQGKNSAAQRKVALEALNEALKKHGIVSQDFRVLGYNGPSVPNEKKTWEMLAVLPSK